MADPLSAIAGIVGIAAAAASLANTVYKFSDNISNARIQMCDVASEMIQLSKILSTLHTVLKQGHGLYKPQILADTKSILDRVEKIQQEIRRIIKRNSGLRARVKWALSSGKVAELLDRIEALKSSLGIVLTAVQLAMAFREPQKPDVEIERLKQLVIAGVREIRQSMITLQQTRPAIEFNPPKMLTAGSPSPNRNKAVSAPDRGRGTTAHHQSRSGGVSPPAEVHGSRRSKPQMETATWLYQMTLASSAGFDPDLLLGTYDFTTGEPFFDDRTRKSIAGQASTSSVPSSLIKLPSPQQLHKTSVLAVARKVVQDWTYLEPTELLLEENGAGHVLFDAHETNNIQESDEDTSSDEGWSPEASRFAPNDSTPFGQHPLAPNPSYPGLNGPGVNPYAAYASVPSPPPQRSTPRPSTPPLQGHFKYPPEYPSPPPITPPPPPPDVKEEGMLHKLEKLLLGKAEEDEKEAMRMRRATENARFDRLESILIAQQEAEIAKDKAEQTAAAENAAQVAEIRKMIREDKLIRIEELILSQREEQLEREAAAAAAKEADAEAAKLVDLKIRQEKEAASALLGAAIQARKEVETEAAEQAEIVRKAHEGALSKAQRTIKEMEDMVGEERRLREETKRDENERSAMQKVRLAANNLVDVVYGKEEKKLYMTTDGPACIDTGNGSSARQIFDNMLQEIEDDEGQRNMIGPISEPTCLNLENQNDGRYEIAKLSGSTDLFQAPGKCSLIFPLGTKQTTPQDKDLILALQRAGIESLFEIDTRQLKNTTQNHSLDPGRGQNDFFITSSLLWQRLPAHGQSELYESLCKSGWKPTYLRSSESGQTWFHGPRPIHVRFESPSYIPRFTDFESDISHECVIIGSDVVDEEALSKTGVAYEALQSGGWMLEAGLTYEDITALIATSFMLRETSLRSVARKAMGTSTKRLRSRIAAPVLKAQIEGCIGEDAQSLVAVADEGT